MKTKADVMIRWLIKRDMKEVLEIERHSFLEPWTEEDFLCCLRQRNSIGMVADNGCEIIGFMLYELHKDELRLLTIAVHQAYRRQGVATAMMERMIVKLSEQRRKRIVLECSEINLEAQVFLRRQRFVAYAVLREFFDDGSDAYAFRYSLNAAEEVHPWIPTNRISI